jgi:hypothetical protein
MLLGEYQKCICDTQNEDGAFNCYTEKDSTDGVFMDEKFAQG